MNRFEQLENKGNYGPEPTVSAWTLNVESVQQVTGATEEEARGYIKSIRLECDYSEGFDPDGLRPGIDY